MRTIFSNRESFLDKPPRKKKKREREREIDMEREKFLMVSSGTLGQ